MNGRCYTFTFHPEEQTLSLISARDLTIDTLPEISCDDLPFIARDYHWETQHEVTKDEILSIHSNQIRSPHNPVLCSTEHDTWIQYLYEAGYTLSPSHYEGYMVLDTIHHIRLRVNSPARTVLSQLAQHPKLRIESVKGREKLFLRLVRMSHAHHVNLAPYYPKWKVWLEYVEAELDELCRIIDTEFQPLKDIEDDAEFARKIPRHVRYPRILFVLKRFRDQYPDAKSFYSHPSTLIDIKEGGSLDTMLSTLVQKRDTIKTYTYA